jgi:glutamyl-tRNA reductase
MDHLDAVTIESQRDAVAALCSESAVTEAFVLQTCNRVEGYVVTEDADAGRAALDSFVEPAPETAVRELGHEESLRHLLRVAAGLESLVIGEDQILGQVRSAYEDARSVDGIGPVLEDGITKAIRVGERARTETAINEGVVSLASAAVRLAAEKRGLAGRTAIVVGAGDMGTRATKQLADRVDRLVIANRTEANARELATLVRPASATVETIDLSDVSTRLSDADVLISATGASDQILDAAAFDGAQNTLVVDIARPRDVSVTVDDRESITVYDLDRLESVTEKTRQMRREAAVRVESIVDEEFERLLAQYKRKRADEVISAMYEGAERIKTQELETALGKLDMDEEDRQVIESMADAIVSQLLAAPTDSLRDAAEADDWSTIHTALRLFNPHVSPEESPVSDEMPFTSNTPADASPDEIPDHVREQLPAGVLDQFE